MSVYCNHSYSAFTHVFCLFKSFKVNGFNENTASQNNSDAQFILTICRITRPSFNFIFFSAQIKKNVVKIIFSIRFQQEPRVRTGPMVGWRRGRSIGN